MILVDPATGEAVEVLPEQVVGPEPYDYAQAKRKANGLSLEARTVIADYKTAVEERKRATKAHRQALSMAVLEARTEHGATLAETVAKGTDEVAGAEADKIAAEGMVRVQEERRKLSSEDRASFHRLVEWSMKANPDGWE